MSTIYTTDYMNTDFYILGSGGMAREVYEIYLANGADDRVKGFVVQDGYPHDKEINGKPVFNEAKLSSVDLGKTKLICGIGSPLRKKWLDQLESRGFNFDIAIHPDACIGKNVTLDSGVIILPGAVLTTNVHVSKQTIINVSATLSHDVIVGEYCTVSPGSHIAGRVHIGNQVFIGIGVSCIPNIKVGDGSYVGAGSVVVQEILNGKMYYGVPAKAIRNLTENDWKRLI